MLSFWRAGIGVLMIFLPGFLLIQLFKRRFPGITKLDVLIGSIVLSQLWNFVFFFFRLLPYSRLVLYLVATGVLFITVLVQLNLKSLFKRIKVVLKKTGVEEILYPIIVVLLAVYFAGSPISSLILSKTALDPVGGDVEYSNFKSHLLRGGYSIFDDLYYGQIPSHPNLVTSQVALMSLLTDGGTSWNAEILRVIQVTLYFIFFWAIGRAVKLGFNESLILAYFILSSARILQHMTIFIIAGMSFFSTLPFFYFLIRAFRENNQFLWSLAGIGAFLTIHTHPAHAVFAGIVSVILLFGFSAIHGFKKTIISSRWFVLFAALGSIIYILPLIIMYRLEVTTGFNFDIDMGVTTLMRLKQLLIENKLILAAIIISIFTLSLFMVPKYKKKLFYISKTLTFPAFIFLTITLTTVILQSWAIEKGIMGLYIDSNDFIDIMYGFGLMVFFLLLFSILDLLSKYWKYHEVTISATKTFFLIAFAISLTFDNPLINEKNEYLKIWKLRELPRADQNLRALESNTDRQTIDVHANELHKRVPPFTSAILMSPSNLSIVGAALERQVVVYFDPYTNFFLYPTLNERQNDVKNFALNPSEDTLDVLIKKYHLTHINWDIRDMNPRLQEFLISTPRLIDRGLLSFIGKLYEVKQSSL